MFALPFFSLPLIVIALWLFAFFKNRRTGLIKSLFAFIATAIIGTISIFQSHSSTAGLGFLFLPHYAVFAGLLVWCYERFKLSDKTFLRVFAKICLVGCLALNLVLIYGGYRSHSQNANFQREQKARQELIENHRIWIKKNIESQGPNAIIWVNEMAIQKVADLDFMFAVLNEKTISAETLEKIFSLNNQSHWLSIAQHPNASTNILQQIYNSKNSPEYYYQALASHKNTPPEILHRLHLNPSYMSNLDETLSQNPSIATETLLSILEKTKNVHAMLNSFENEKFNCELFRKIQSRYLVLGTVKPDDFQDNYKEWSRFLEKLNSLKVQCQ